MRSLIRRIIKFSYSWAFKRNIDTSKIEISSVSHLLIGDQPRVEIIIPTRDRADLLRASIGSIERLTEYKNYGITIVDNGSVEPDTLKLLDELRTRGVRVIPLDIPFNYSILCNTAIATIESEFICLLNNDAEIIEKNWLSGLVAHITVPGVGIVGAQLLYPNGEIQHNGVYFGLGGIATHLKKKISRSSGAKNSCSYSQATTFACAMFRKSLWTDLGGLDEDFPVGLNDVDFCAKTFQKGEKIAICANSPVAHIESASRPSKLSAGGFYRGLLDVVLFLKKHPAWYENKIQ